MDRVVNGLHYGVVVAGGYVGIYYTHAHEKPGPVEGVVGESLSYAWRILSKLDATLSTRAAAWGMVAAATTAWLDSGGRVEPGEELGIEGARRVAMIGFIEPLAERLAGSGVEVVAFDRNPAARRWGCLGERLRVLPDTYAQPMLEEGGFDAVIVSGSVLAHPGAAAAIAEAARSGGAGEIILLGPSAGIHPWICARLGYTRVAGSYAPREAREELVAMVEAGYGYRRMKRLLVKWSAPCKGFG